MDYIVDKSRKEQYQNDGTGIFVRAKDEDGKWGSFDILWLTKESLLSWLRSRGGENSWAENCVGILLGYGNIVE